MFEIVFSLAKLGQCNLALREMTRISIHTLMRVVGPEAY